MRAMWAVLSLFAATGVVGCSSQPAESIPSSVTVSVTSTAAPVTETLTAAPVTQTESIPVTETVVTTEVRRHLIVRVDTFDTATSTVTLVKQILSQPELSQAHLVDDVADPTVYTLKVASDAEVGLIYTPCGTRDDLARNGVIPCSVGDLATSVNRSPVYAEIEASDTTIFWAHEVYQA